MLFIIIILKNIAKETNKHVFGYLFLETQFLKSVIYHNRTVLKFLQNVCAKLQAMVENKRGRILIIYSH